MKGFSLLQDTVILDHGLLSLLPGYVYLRLKNGTYQYANERFAKLLGFSLATELVDQKSSRFRKKSLVANQSLEPMFASDDQFFIKVSPKITELALSMHDEVGRSCQFLSKQMPVYQDKALVGLLVVMLSGYEQATVEKMNLLENVVAFVPGSVYWMDRRGAYLGCNDECARLLGMPKKLIVGTTAQEQGEYLGWPEARGASFARDDFEVMETGRPILHREEEPFVDASGNTVYQLTNKAPLFDEYQEVIGLVGNAVDITTQKQSELALTKAKKEAEEANQAKSEFLAMMTHELRTPLNVTMGMAQLMQNDQCTPDEREDFLSTMMLSGKSLLRLINNILDFSKIQSGALKLRSAPFSLDELLQQLAMEFSVRAKEMRVGFELKKPRSLPEYIVTDRMRLRQILYNLCDNAMKFTGKGKVTLKIQLLKAQKKGCVRVKFMIQDTGIGIPSEKLESIFEEFSQVNTEKHDEYSRRYGGVGLGLSIVKKMAGLMDAKLRVKSELDQGTTFACAFDFGLPTAKEIAIIQEDARHYVADRLVVPPSNILVVEDNKMNQKVIIHMLERLNAKVEIAKNGKEALTKLKKRYDIVLMDMSLPDFSGPEATRRYRKVEPENRHQIIVAVTANVHADDQKKCIDAGMDGFLTKPIMLDQLRKVLLDKLVFH